MFFNGGQELLGASTRKVSAAYATGKEGVTGKQVWLRIETNATRRVARCMDDRQVFIAKGERIAIFDRFIHRWRCRQTKLGEKLFDIVLAEEVCVSSVHDDIGTSGFFKTTVATDMIRMTMGVNDIFYSDIFCFAG